MTKRTWTVSLALSAVLLLVAPAARADGLEIVNQSSAPVVDTFTTENADFHASMFLRNSAKDEVQVTLSASQLQSADGRLFPLSMNVGGTQEKPGEPIHVPSGGTVQIMIATNLPEVGIYRADLTVLSTSAPPKTLAFSIERKSLTLPDGFVDIPALFRQDLSFLPDRAIVLKGALQNVLGRLVQINLPQIAEIDQKQGAASYALTDVTAVTTLDCPAHKGERGNVVQLSAFERCPFSISLTGLSGGALYELKLAIAGAVVSKTVSVSVRSHWLWAALLIIASTLAAVALRWWRGTGRTLIVQLGVVAGLTERIAQLRSRLPDGDRKSTVDTVDSNVAALASDLRDGSVSGQAADARIAAMKQETVLLAAWLQIEADYDRLTAQERNPIAEMRRQAMASIVTNRETIDPAAKKSVDDYVQAVSNALTASLRQQASNFVDSVDGYLAALQNEASGDALVAEISALRTASDKLKNTNDMNNMDLSNAIAAAHRSYVLLNVKLLELRLKEPAPATFDSADWNSHCAKLVTKLQVVRDRAQASVPDAEAYLNGLLTDHARIMFDQLSQCKKEAVEKASDTNIKTKLNQLPITEPPESLDSNTFEIWYAREKRERTAIAGSVTTLAEGKLEGFAPAVAVADEGALDISVDRGVFDLNVGQILLPPPNTRSSTYGIYEKWGNWAVNLVIVGLVGASGLQALWISNFAWGSMADLTAAVFWGAGVGYGLGAGVDELLKKGIPAAVP